MAAAYQHRVNFVKYLTKQTIYLSIYPFIRPSVSRNVCPSVRLSTSLPIDPSICLPVCLRYLSSRISHEVRTNDNARLRFVPRGLYAVVSVCGTQNRFDGYMCACLSRSACRQSSHRTFTHMCRGLLSTDHSVFCYIAEHDVMVFWKLKPGDE